MYLFTCGRSSHCLSFFYAQGPCHIELHAAMDTISSSRQTLGEKFTTFYLPNCDRHGFYKPKQVRTSGFYENKIHSTCEKRLILKANWVIYSCGFLSLFLFQCESSLVGPPARCWCVSSWNGEKLPGSSDLLGDSECHQEVTH